jgi:thioredoxin-like negative regulator of GroEL
MEENDAVRTFDDVIKGMVPEDAEIVVKYVQSESDRRITSAMKTHDQNNPRAGDAAKQLAARLERLEAAHSASVKAADLRFEIFKAASAAGVSYDLVQDIPFKDLKEARKKIEQIAKAVKTTETAAINKFVVDNGGKPGSGNPTESVKDIKTLSFQERIDLLEHDPKRYNEMARKAR